MLANCVFYHNQLVMRMIHNLGTNFMTTAAAENIINDLKKGKTLVLAIVQQLMGNYNSRFLHGLVSNLRNIVYIIQKAQLCIRTQILREDSL